MHSRAEYYRRRALEAQQRAAQTSAPKIRDMFEDVAEGWFELAELLDWPDWPAPGSEDTELGVLMELEVGHGETEVHAGVQA